MSASAPGSVIERRNAPIRRVGAAQLEDLLDHRAVLALELAASLSRRTSSSMLGHLDPQLAVRAGAAAAPATPR